jgi:hypothetical protein
MVQGLAKIILGLLKLAGVALFCVAGVALLHGGGASLWLFLVLGAGMTAGLSLLDKKVPPPQAGHAGNFIVLLLNTIGLFLVGVGFIIFVIRIDYLFVTAGVMIVAGVFSFIISQFAYRRLAAKQSPPPEEKVPDQTA